MQSTRGKKENIMSLTTHILVSTYYHTIIPTMHKSHKYALSFRYSDQNIEFDLVSPIHASCPRIIDNFNANQTQSYSSM